jgi:cytochrome b561
MKQKYHISIRIIHWLMAVIILGMIGVGWFMVGLDKSVPYRANLYFLHKSFGVTILLLVILRLILRISTKIPPLPTAIPLIIRRLVRVDQAFIYIFMFAVPLSGYAMTNMFGHGVDFFGLGEIPRIFSENIELGKLIHNSHKVLAYTLLALVTLHILGALKHKFFDKNPKNDILKTII